MKAPAQGPALAHRFTSQHQINAARARHAATQREQAAFEGWLDTAWKSSDFYGRDIRRFVSVIRQRIYQGAFKSEFTVTPATLCDWICRWRKTRLMPFAASERTQGKPND